ncbi:MAG: hypothetical protein WCE45_01095 [Sedimentisphaerales bacterium]
MDIIAAAVPAVVAPAAAVFAVMVKRVIIRQQSIVATMEPEKPVPTGNPVAAVRAAIVSIAKVAWVVNVKFVVATRINAA